ncbi:MAG TPA: tRNA (N6-isopentenyl adenosine(37)-C2)-methylthiotransferase MiaB [Clostridia bacterium]|nr:tRNA (N6-isopentenyl adenosine(37)-C2)-methylthiotransferase MiaB [Clostridia bacterium]
MNERDSEIIGGILEGLGYQPSEDITQADLILFNTCSIRDSAERKIYGKIGEIKRLKNNNPDLIIGVAGCMAQKDREKIAKKAPHVDFILGTNNLHKLPELITRAKNSKETLIDIVEERAEIENEIEENRSKLTTQKIKASVNIMYGCNNFCTYCIVPYVRGREKSRPFKQIIEEIEQLGKEGVKEVTLLGQNVNSYGKDLGENIDFADLLAAIDNIPGIERIRYMTSHPRDFSDKLIQVIKNSSKVCEHFHLPIQSGCDKILRDMNRGYTTSQYAILVEKIRQSNPNASITTDIIVGFPGETEEDFEETLNFIKKIKFDQAYTFIYSRRSGTPAANLPNQIPLETKKQRLQQLISVQNEISLELNKNYIGKTVEVLVEGTSKNNPEKLTGRTRTNKIVIFSGDQQLTGQLVMVKIDKAKTWTLEGKILKD